MLIDRRERTSRCTIAFSELEALVLLVRYVEMDLRKQNEAGCPGPEPKQLEDL